MKAWLIALSILGSVQAFSETNADPFKAKSLSSHEIVLLNSGLGALEARLQMLERAKKSIDVEYFIYSLDKSGRIFTQALIKKAKEGVKVRMLLDYAMIKSQFSNFYAHEMNKHGIEVKYFNPTATLNLFSGTYRNHRKSLIIDAEEAITGGRNIADEYFDLREDFNFLDRDLLFKGEIVKSVQTTFDQVFNNSLSKVVARDRMPEATDAKYRGDHGSSQGNYPYDLKQWNKKVNDAKEFLTVSDDAKVLEIRTKGQDILNKEFHGNCSDMSFNSEYPVIGQQNRSLRVIKHDIAERIKNTQKVLLFDSPYFITDSESEKALNTALENKVEVTFLTNSLNSTDAIYVYDVFKSIIGKWIDKGIVPYIYKGNVPATYEVLDETISKARFGVHAKTFVFDDKNSIIGTYNFDPRSANLNTEMTIACDNNPELAKAVTDDIKLRINESLVLDSREAVQNTAFYEVGFLKKLGYIFLKIPSNIFSYLL